MALITSYWSQDLLLYVTLFFVGLYFYLTRNFNYWKSIGIKEFSSSLFSRNVVPCILQMQHPTEFIQEVYEAGKGEKLFGFYVLDQPYLLVRDPEFIKHIFIKDFDNFSNKLICGNDSDTMGQRNIFLIRNPPWKQIRKKLTPVFTSGKLKRMFELMLEICEEFHALCDTLKIDDKIGKPVEVKELCANITTDFIGLSAFGMKFNSLNNPEAEFRKYGKAIFDSNYKRYLQTLAILFIPQLRPFVRAKFFGDGGSKFFRDTFLHVINERIRMGNTRNDLIDLLIDMKKSQENDQSDNYKLEDDDVVAQAAIFFTGGFETSSTTVAFALYELAKNIELQDKLRKEIMTALEREDGKITFEMVTTSLPYLSSVVYETLRLYPVVTWLDRIPNNDYTFPGTNITVKKNTPCILPTRALHMDPEYFPNPEVFDPDRFSEENKKKIVPFTYFPFGQGPRNCIGERYGGIQSRLMLINFIKRFEVTPCKDTPMQMKFDQHSIFMHAAGKLNLNFREIVHE